MTSSKPKIANVAIIFAIFLIVFVLSRDNSEKVNNLITILTAIFGFVAIIYQLRMDHKIKRAEFIYSLNDTFTSDEDITYIYMKLKLSRDNTETLFSEDDGRRMGNYIMFFLILNYLIKQGLVDYKMIDSIFSNKFFLFCNNKYVQEYQLKYTELNIEIIELFQNWYNYRVRKKSTILYPKECFSNYNDYFIRNKNGLIKFNTDYANITYDNVDKKLKGKSVI